VATSRAIAADTGVLFGRFGGNQDFARRRLLVPIIGPSCWGTGQVRSDGSHRSPMAPMRCGVL